MIKLNKTQKKAIELFKTANKVTLGENEDQAIAYKSADENGFVCPFGGVHYKTVNFLLENNLIKVAGKNEYCETILELIK